MSGMPRRLAALVACLLLAAGVSAQRGEPFMPVGVEYRLPPTASADVVARDYQEFRKLGYNTVVLNVWWGDTEPERGRYRFDALTRALELAESVALRVVLQLEIVVPPRWALERSPDGRYQPATPRAFPESRGCVDHPTLRADALAFVRAASAQVASARSVLAIDVGSDLPSEICLCPSSQRRFEAWSKESASADRDLYFRAAARADLEQLAETAANVGFKSVISHADRPSILHGIAGGPGQDDWQMASVVDAYGGAPPDWEPKVRYLLAFAGLASATHANGWWLWKSSVPNADALRLMAWSALSRGARGLVFAAGQQQPPQLAAIVARNPGLFLPLRPRQAQVAILHEPRGDALALLDVYRELLAGNVAADVISLQELDAATAQRYRLFVRAGSGALPPRLQAIRDARGTVVDVGVGTAWQKPLADAMTSMGIRPEVRLSGSNGLIETRFLESSTVLMLIALNHGDTSQKVTMTFTPDTQEAIWVNMETGAGVNFIAGPNGPSYSYWFRPRDALVLMIRKDVR